ncbi:MAG: Motility protein B [Alphaproteobacteria bacterium MarineAlpha4_Bin2]|nr:MAG: Motility protein B [Alphaproteobacteria bacterium MarineAlpha4_Bin2]
MAKPEKKSDGDGEDWLATYADAITLLMAFFVMILHFKDYDAAGKETAAQAIRDSMGIVAESTTVSYEESLFNMLNDASHIVETSGIPKDEYIIEFDHEGIIMEFFGKTFFEPASVKLAKKSEQVVKQIGEELTKEEYTLFNVEIEGHTDDVPIKSKYYPTNWELSAGRAAAVVSRFITAGIKPNRLKASGYAGTKPKFPNKDMFNEPIPENRAANRRVIIRLKK